MHVYEFFMNVLYLIAYPTVWSIVICRCGLRKCVLNTLMDGFDWPVGASATITDGLLSLLQERGMNDPYPHLFGSTRTLTLKSLQEGQ